jgi:signal transduction histidine kinase
LRTPNTTSRGSGVRLGGRPAAQIPPTAKALLGVANRNCDRLVRLINDILDVEKIESGSMSFALAEQALLPLVEQAVAATQAFAQQYQVSLSIDMQAAEMRVNVDADRLAQVLVNLLSNAAKFAPAGDTVVVCLARAGAFARVSVVDHGVGIPAAFRERIFQKFAQADASDTRRIGGTGLGLNISKAIIEKHHGRMDFTSEPGVRTEFFFELPLQFPPERQP